MNLMKKLKLRHMRRLRAGLRRGMAFALTLTMMLPMASVFAKEIYPYPPMTATSADIPKIEVEGNFVRDDFGILTGYFEIGLRVQTPTDRTFQYIGVTLEYNPNLFTPVDWEPVGNLKTVGATGKYSTVLDAKAIDGVATALPRAGIVNPSGDNHSVLYFTARANEPLSLPEMTTVAAIRFKVSNDLRSKMSVKKLGKDEYEVHYADAANSVADVAIPDVKTFDTALTASASGTTTKSFSFAPDDAIPGSAVDMALLYQAGGYTTALLSRYGMELYHVPAYDVGDAATYPAVTIERDGYSYNIPKPLTMNDTVLAVDPSKTDPAPGVGGAVVPGTTGKYSYISNLIVNTNPDYVPDPDGTSPTENYIAFTITSKKSFIAQKSELDNLTTIVYVDWDNTLLGTQIVPKNTDVRSLVSDYVAEHFIYHVDDTTYTSDFDLNDVNKMATDAGVTPDKIVSSLERKYNYRGKYPATEPMGLDANGDTLHDSPDTVVDQDVTKPNGGDYPLTNKLDYVFFKRPMEHTVSYETLGDPGTGDPSKYPAEPDVTDTTKYPGGAKDTNYLADLEKYNKAYQDWFFSATEWRQREALDSTGAPTGDPLWDEENPYAYGWAQCTVKNYKDVWTTLGMGELGSTATSTEAGSLSLTTSTPKGYSGAQSGGYRDLSTYANTVASVTYDGGADFAFADLEKGFSDSTVFLKAIYEPGEDLETTGEQYRMISKPYYNKLNSGQASEGGAYSVDVTFERSAQPTLLGGLLVGIARTREPYVRQDVTTDLRWVENESPKVEHDLTNPSNSLAYETKYESSYIKVEVENKDIVDVTLTLSARHNKVDYYLKDAYTMNFVSGGDRSANDSTRSADKEETVIDNYNYYVKGESNEKDNWYDAPYANRNGTYGFVLLGTLNQIMQTASQLNRGEISAAGFNNNVTVATLQDINIKKNGGVEIAITDLANIRRYILDAATLAEPINNSGATTYWDTEHNCAKLTYHQLQGYIIQRTGGGGTPTLNHPESVLSSPVNLSWCHLHQKCAAASSSAPSNWKELIEAARSNPAYIDLMTQGEAEKMTNLRKDINGTVTPTGDGFASLSEFKTIIVDAVKNLDAAAGGGTITTIYTWDQVQKQILIDQGDPKGATSVPNEDYWWYDGATTSTISNYPTDFLTAVKHATDTTLTCPDGSTGARAAKLNQLEKAYDDNKAAADATYAATDAAWVKATENLAITIPALAPQDEGRPWNSFADFKTAVKDAYTLLKGTYAEPDWYQMQYVILNYADVSGSVKPIPLPKGDAGEPADYATYWWHDGELPITDIKSMLDAAIKDGSGWKNFDQTKLDALIAADPSSFYIVSKFDGTKFPDIASFKAAVKTVADNNASNTALTWEELQYLIIHAGDASAPTTPATVPPGAIAKESATYYWWSGGVTTPPVMTYPADTVLAPKIKSTKKSDADISELLMAAFRISKNGILPADHGLTADLLKAYRFQSVRPSGSDDYTVNLIDATSLINNVITLLDGARAAGYGTEYEPPDYLDLNWFQVQYAILNGGAYVTPGAAPTDTSSISDTVNYWWRVNDKLEDKFGDLLGNMYKAYSGSLTKATFRSSTTAADLDGAGLKYSDGNAFGTNATKRNNAMNLIYDFIDALATDGSAVVSDYVDTTNGKLKLSSSEVQTIINNRTTPKGSYSTVGAMVYHTIIKPAHVAPYTVMPIVFLEEPGSDIVAEERDLNERLLEDADTLAELKENKEYHDLLIARLELLTGKKVELKEANHTGSTSTPTPEKASEPSASPEPEVTPAPTETPVPVETPAPAETAEPTETPAPAETAEPTATPAPTETAEPTETPAPAETAEPTETPAPAETAEPAETPAPAEPSEPTETPAPEKDPEPAETPAPLETPEPVKLIGPAEPTEPVEPPEPSETPAAPEEPPAPEDPEVTASTADPPDPAPPNEEDPVGDGGEGEVPKEPDTSPIETLSMVNFSPQRSTRIRFEQLTTHKAPLTTTNGRTYA